MTRVLVTGISGFIAGHIMIELLSRGYVVRGTVRSMAKADGLREICREHGHSTADLEFAVADLESDEGWKEAMADCDAVIHTASPFPMEEPDDKMGLVPSARGGTLRVLNFARQAGIEKVVLTSSTVAVTNNQTKPEGYVFSADDWTNTEGDLIRAYAVSKTLAEKAAWEDVEQNGGPRLAVINPSFVVGPLISDVLGTSATLIKQMFEGKYPAVPELCFGVVDVRDVAKAHVQALETEAAFGRRIIVAGGTRVMIEMVDCLRSSFPEHKRKLPKFQAPLFMVKLLGVFQKSVRGILPEVGKIYDLNTEPARNILGLQLRSPEEGLRALAKSLIDRGLIK